MGSHQGDKSHNTPEFWRLTWSAAFRAANANGPPAPFRRGTAFATMAS
jgi:hypothetical protein